MRNVVKGFQFSQMAVPKTTHIGINTAFTNYHSPRAPKVQGQSRLIRMAPKSPNPAPARRPGKNVAIKNGYKV